MANMSYNSLLTNVPYPYFVGQLHCRVNSNAVNLTLHWAQCCFPLWLQCLAKTAWMQQILYLLQLIPHSSSSPGTICMQIFPSTLTSVDCRGHNAEVGDLPLKRQNRPYSTLDVLGCEFARARPVVMYQERKARTWPRCSASDTCYIEPSVAA